jgi:hypothetical protein
MRLLILSAIVNALLAGAKDLAGAVRAQRPYQVLKKYNHLALERRRGGFKDELRGCSINPTWRFRYV